MFGGSTKPSLTWMLPVAWVELRVETRFVENNCRENNLVSLHTRKGETRDGEHWGASHAIDVRACHSVVARRARRSGTTNASMPAETLARVSIASASSR